MATFGTIQSDADRSDGGTFAFDNDGSGSLVAHLLVYDLSTDTPALSWNGVSMGAARHSVVDAFSVAAFSFVLESPATGTHNIVVSGLTNARHRVIFVPTNGTSTVRGGAGSNGGGAASNTSATAAVTTVAGDLVSAGLVIGLAADPTVVATGDATQSAEGAVAPASTSGWGWGGTATAADTTTDMGASWTGASGCALSAVALVAAASGPTIDTQPQADTGLINGDATRRTTVYTCAASTADGGGITGLDWFEDTDAISDGGVYDIVTTGLGTANASSTLTITRIAKTGTPFSMNARATDANGGTDSDAVNDTWYTGPVLSASSGTTNASGVDEIGIVSDYANADGEFTVVTATAGGVTKQVALHYETPA